MKRNHFFLASIVSFLASVSMVMAQGTTASIVGEVYDPSGAIVPGAAVTAVHVDTGTVRTALTNEAGRYAFRNLQTGRYIVSVEVAGFKKAQVSDITLLIDQTASIDLHLQAGEITETVTVEGSVLPLLNTATSDVGEVVENRRIVELPLNQREFLQLARLAPGVAPPVPGSLNIRDQGGEWAAIQASGLRVEYQTVTINGLLNMDPQNNNLAVRPSIDAVQEFKIQTSNFSAELPSKGGAVINLAIKSGTNQWHGSLFEFNRNSAFRARSFFEGERRNLNQNQFGGTVGGPILKDKSFFFGAYEARRIRRPTPVIGTLPTPEQRRGIFDPQSFGAIYDPLTFDPGTLTRKPFPNNTIPQDRISPISRKILEFVPLPNHPDPLRNFQRVLGNEDDMDQLNARFDHHFGGNDTLMFNFNITDHERLFLGTLEPFARGGFGVGVGGLRFSNQAQHWNSVYTHVFSPTAINELRLGVMRWEYNRVGQNRGTNFARNTFGIPGSETRDELTDFIGLNVVGYSLPTENTGSVYRNTVYQMGDHFTWIKGDHNFKTGFDLYQTLTFNRQCECAGAFGFNGQYVSAGRAASNGDAFAQFLLGTPSSMSRWDRRFFGNMWGWTYGFYFQDDWRVTNKLTFNLGLRYDFAFPMKEKSDFMANWDPATGETVYPRGINLIDCDPATGQCKPWVPPFRFRLAEGRTLYETDKANWAPRFGLAYELTPRTVLRAAYGIFNASFLLTRHEILSTFNAPALFIRSINTNLDVPNASFEQGFAGPDLLGLGFGGNVTWAPRPFRNFHNAYVQMWNMGFQIGLSKDVMLDLAYVGSKGTHLTADTTQNLPLPGPGNLQARRPFPDHGPITLFTDGLNSHYHSLQAKLSKRFTGGLSFNAAYTWSKVIDNSSQDVGSATDGSGIENPFLARQSTRGLAAFDLPHRFVFSYVWELPSPQDRVLRQVAGGWQVTGIWTLQSGWPFTVAANSRTNNGTGSRPNRGCDGKLDQPTIDRWFDTNCFTVPEIFTYGNSGRNILRTDGLVSFDVGVFKNWRVPKLGEQGRFQFRAEFFNLFNHPTFGVPVRNINARNAGAITDASLGREIQFGAKLLF